MRILTRCVGEAIYIGDDITVTVLDVKDDRVQLDVLAPDSSLVYLEEPDQSPNPSEKGPVEPNPTRIHK